MYIGHRSFRTRDHSGVLPSRGRRTEIWVQEDIMNYGTDYRVHIIRTDDENKEFISNACNIDFRNHTSEERISHEEFHNNITNHLVIAIKGFYRRANLTRTNGK
jgi:hypothetical protein